MELFSYKYAIPYLIFMGYLIVLMCVEFRKIRKQQSTRGIRILTVTSFIFFFGLRGFVYTDWYSYYPFFNSLPTIGDNGLYHVFHNSAYDVGFELYAVLLKSLCPNYFFWIFISCCIDMAILHSCFKRYIPNYYVFGFIVFFVLGGCIIEINLLRNIKAILLFMLSLRYLQERKIAPYMLLNLIGVSFHLSAVVYFPLYFVLHKEFSKLFLWTIFIAGNIIFLFQIPYIQPVFTFFADLIGPQAATKVQIYFNDSLYNKPYGMSIGYFERVISYILLVSFYIRLKNQNRHNIILINVFVLYFICFFYFAELQVVNTRMAFLFIFAYWLLFPKLYSILQVKTNKMLFMILFFCTSIGRVTIHNNNLLQEYDNLICGIKSYEVRKDNFDKHKNAIFKTD
jgi:uncharacterized membrane protein (UPF0136 family)